MILGMCYAYLKTTYILYALFTGNADPLVDAITAFGNFFTQNRVGVGIVNVFN